MRKPPRFERYARWCERSDFYLEITPLDFLFLVSFSSSDAVVDVCNEGIDVQPVGSCALADGFKVGGHAADTAEAILHEDFDDLRMLLHREDNRGICSDFSMVG